MLRNLKRNEQGVVTHLKDPTKPLEVNLYLDFLTAKAKGEQVTLNNILAFDKTRIPWCIFLKLHGLTFQDVPSLNAAFFQWDDFE